MDSNESNLSQELPIQYSFKEEIIHSILTEGDRQQDETVPINLGTQTSVYFSNVSTLPLLPFEIKVKKDRITTRHDFEVLIDRRVMEGAGSIGSTVASGSIKSDDVRTFPHDFTFRPIALKTDVEISTAFGCVKTPLSSLTPDYIAYHNGELIVMEFATTQNDRGVMDVLNGKVDKYFIPIREAARERYLRDKVRVKINLCVIVASRTRIACTHRMPQEVIDELVYRYNLSLSIQNHAYHLLGLEKRDDNDERKSISELKTFFESIKVTDLGGEFSYENYMKIMREPTQEEEFDIIHKIIDSAKETVKNMAYQFSSKFTPGTGERNPNVKDCMTKFYSYLDDAIEENRERGLRSDSKSMVQIPFISLIRTKKYSFSSPIRLHNIPEPSPDDSTLKLIRNIILEVDSGRVYVPEELEDDVACLKNLFDENNGDLTLLEEHILRHPEIYSKEVQEQITNRSKYHRVVVKLDSISELELAKIGINGKKHASNAEIKLNRNDKKKFFDPKITDTSDLDKVLQDEKLITSLFTPEELIRDVNTDVKTLIYTSLGMHSNPSTLSIASSNYYNDIMSSHIGSFCSMISDIGVELAISIKQNCSRNEYIVKKLRHFDLWLIVKPTKSTSHIFFSMFLYGDSLANSLRDCNPEMMRSVFKNLNRTGNFYYTDFVSLNLSKLVNWVLCESRLFASYSFWLNAHGCPAIQTKDDKAVYHNKTLAARKMTLLTIIVNLVDKAEVEEHMSLLRYITLEGLTCAPNIPNPQKMFSKFSKQIRSRLTLWIIRKLFSYSLSVADGVIKLDFEGIEDQATNTRDRKTWNGFMNPYLNSPVDSPQLMINLFYLGYLKNKDEYPENNTITKLYEKILVIEDELTPELESQIGMRDKQWGSEDKHTYNLTMIKLATNYALNHMKKTNPRFKKDMENLILSNLASVGLDPTFTTLKASSSFNSELFPLKSVGNNYSRMKVIEALSKSLKGDDYRLVDILPQVCTEVFERKYLLIDIFQKNQHGGLREIYVLGLFDRIVQYVIETISRTICSSFPGETMTHPNNKKQIPDSHHFKSNQRFRDGYVTFGVSADASKWSQNHYAHKFSVFLLRFLPQYMHGFIWNTLHLWKDKRIMLNPKLVEILDNPKIEGFYSAPIQSLYDAYHGRKDISWYKMGTSYVQTKTGMMQGILHYTSSLLHSILNEFSKDIVLLTFGVEMKKMELPEIDMLQSSDDSAMIISFPLDSSGVKGVRKSQLRSCLAQEIKAVIGRECSIINSIKTTNSSLFFHEFNSEFKFGSNHYRPDIKFMISLPLISEQEAIVARQEEWSTLLTQYIENGGSTWPVHIGQVSQAMIHYRLLGSSVSGRFEDFAVLGNLARDPSQGYFLMDPILSAGLLGFKYNLWNACRQSNLGKLYKNYLFKSTSQDQDKLEVTQSGSLSRTVKIIYGDKKKWLKMLARVGVEDDWRELVNQDFKMLYVGVSSNAELRRMISLKMHTTGVAESISKGNVLSRTIASSVYLLTSKCLTKLKDWQISKGQEHIKVSLFDLLRESIKMLSSSDSSLSDGEMRVLFPFHDDFKTIESTLKGLERVYLYPTYKDYRRRITSIEVANCVKISNLPLKDIVTQVWFPEEKRQPNISAKTANMLFDEFKLSINWLNTDPFKTISDGPFDDAVSLYNWISSVSTKERVVRLLGTPILSFHGKSNLISAILLNFQTNYRLEQDQAFKVEDERVHLKHIFYMISRSPFSKIRAENLLEDALRCEDLQISYNSNIKRSRDNVLSIIQSAYFGAPLYELAQKITDNRIGVTGGFIRRGDSRKVAFSPRRKITYEGEAVWEGLIHGMEIRLISDSVPGSEPEAKTKFTGRLKQIEVQDVSQVLYISNDIRSLCNELGLQYNHRDTIKLDRGTIFGLASSGISGNFGVPIIKSISKFKFDLDSVRRCEVEIQRHVIRLKALMFDGTKITLLSYSILESDYFDSQMELPTSFLNSINPRARDQAKSWICNEPIPLSASNYLLDSVAGIYDKGFENASKDDKHKAQVIREVLVAALIRSGLNKHEGESQFKNAASKQNPNLSIEDDFELEEINYDEAWGEQFDFSFDDSEEVVCSQGSEVWGEEVMIEDERFDLSMYIDLMNTEPEIEYTESLVFRNHQMLNNLVRDIFGKFGIVTLRHCFKTLKVSRLTESLRKPLAVYAGTATSQISEEEDHQQSGNFRFDFD